MAGVEPRTVSYAAWGEAFFAVAVTPARILASVNQLAGQPIDVGPFGVGPGKLAKVSATGAIDRATCKPLRGTDLGPVEPVAFRVWWPVHLDLVVDLAVDTHRFAADLRVPIVLTAVAQEGLRIFIDATPPRSRDIECRLRADGLRASLLSQVAGVEGELTRFVATYVARELDKPDIVRARTIDVATAIDGVMPS